MDSRAKKDLGRSGRGVPAPRAVIGGARTVGDAHRSLAGPGSTGLRGGRVTGRGERKGQGEKLRVRTWTCHFHKPDKNPLSPRPADGRSVDVEPAPRAPVTAELLPAPPHPGT